MDEQKKITNAFSVKLGNWVTRHYLQLSLFNGFLVLLVPLRSAGYFEPFFTISINFIFITGLILSIFILGTNAKSAIVLAVLFWVLAAVFRVLNINVWAERTALYTYEAFLLAIVLISVRYIRAKRRAVKRMQ